MIDHTGVPVSDLTRSKAWYQKALDAKPDDVFTLRSIAQALAA